MSSKIEKKSVPVPKLRFPGFEGDWEEKNLYEIARGVTQRATPEESGDVLTLSSEHGLIKQRDYFGKKIAGENTDRYISIKQNDFVYNDRVTKVSEFGTIRRLEKYASGIVSPIYKCFRFSVSESPIFWQYYFESGIHDSQLQGFANEGSRAGRFNISTDKFLSTAVFSPDNSEQQHIAAALSSLDSLISAQLDKLTALRQHKQGLMQRLFPAEGEKVPRLRFPEFEADGEWNWKKLRDMSTPVKGRVGDRKLPIVSISAGTGIVSQSSKFGKEIAGDKYKIYIPAKDGDFLYNRGNSKSFPQGCIYFLEGWGEVAAPYVFIVFRLDEGYCKEYSQYLFENNIHGRQLKRYITSSTRDNGLLNVLQDDFYEVSLPAPSLPEQQRISAFLSSLDDLIAAQSDKIKELNTFKRGLMQGLFPSGGAQ